MTEEQVEKGVDLKGQISKTKQTIIEWEKSDSFSPDGIYVHTGRSNQWLPTAPDLFLIVKSVSLAYYNDKLKNLQKQFDEL